MNMLLFERDELKGPELTVAGEKAQHLLKYCAVSPGDEIKVGEAGGRRGVGIVRLIRGNEVTVEIRLEEPPSEPCPASVVLALPRPQMLKRIFEFCGAFAVKHLMLIHSARVEKSYFSSPSLSEVEIRRHLQLGMEQGMSTYEPRVTIHRSFRRFLDEQFEPPAGGQCFIAHPGSAGDLFAASRSALLQDAVFAIGPERGWLENEMNDFGGRGFKPFTLGSSMLRVETAVYFTLAQFDLIRRLPSR